MKPQDHLVIDEREDGRYIYFHDLPPMLLKNPIRMSEADMNPPDQDE